MWELESNHPSKLEQGGKALEEIIDIRDMGQHIVSRHQIGAPAFGGQTQVFVPHAWVMAYVEGHWKGFDAALQRFDAGHIAFDLGDGEPFRFYRGIEAMGGLELIEVALPGGSP